MKFIIAFCSLVILLAGGPALAAEQVAGVVKNVKGEASIERSGQITSAEVGAKIHQKDVLLTGPGGSMGVIFRDDATLSLGPDSRIVVDEFLFSPADGQFSFISKITKGTAAYLSGQIVKLSPESARVETPLAVLGIRGTRFLIKVE